ncbi:phosphatase PAP2 family protein [Flavihumibacter petaseus]|uniref:Phosphatidic acid phosphatase type 2/haloperoxidase domain-containing protein n=1 Tax=Flavihumibacter petaseus NBRC 106054 TaxID=1220578 RepID=A0A0E9N2Z2_9BACT|nr:phosphatase PAP2 family protein [Flavihumibacter petaseus]GAO43720.1 hypothetical protein FPE01S_02_08260 [Flavihumibacter petaseus NBRC 106054]
MKLPRILLAFLALSFSSMRVTAQAPAIDKTTLMEFMEDRTHGHMEFYQGISNSTGAISFAVPVSLFVAAQVRHDPAMTRKALYIGESIAVSSLFTTVLKHTVNRTRPSKDYPGLIIPESSGGSPSFPSGHTSQAFSTATALFIAYPKWYVGVPAFGWASLVGYSRMYLGVHYPSDVAAGALLGAGSAWLTLKANQWINHQHFKKRSLVLN